MAAINFPDSPSDGDTHVVGQVTYTYNSAETKWKTSINANNFLPTTGGTLTGNLNMGTNDLTVGDITASGTVSLSGLTYPTSDGTTGQYLQTDGAGALSWQTVTTTNLTRATSVDTTSGTSVAFHNIPASARRISLLFDQVSLDASGEMRIQLGTGTQASPTWITTNYIGARGYSFYNNTASSEGSVTEIGFRFNHSSAGFGSSGIVTLANLTGNTWVESGVITGGSSSSFAIFSSGGVKDAGATVTQVRVTSLSGTANFDNGQLTIMYEVA